MAADSPEMEAKNPQLRGGSRIKVKIEQIGWHKQFLAHLLYRAKNLPKGPPRKGDDNMLAITNDARKASLDPSLAVGPLVGPNGAPLLDSNGRPRSGRGPEHPNGKLTRIADNVARVYQREQADRELEKFGPGAEGILRDLLPGAPSIEARRRLDRLLSRIDVDKLRTGRALELLEQIGSPAAGELLATLAKGAPGAALTRGAAESLQRLENFRKQTISHQP